MKKYIYLATVIVSFTSMMIMYESIDLIVYFTNRPLFSFYNFAGLLFLMIPMFVFIVLKWSYFKRNLGFFVMASGFTLMVIMISLVYAYALKNPDIEYVNLSVVLYYLMVVGIILIFVAGAVMNDLDQRNSLRDKIMMTVWALSLSLFLLSEIKNFYPMAYMNSDGYYISLNNFTFWLKYEVLIHVLFTKLSMFLAVFGFLASVVTKFISFETPQTIEPEKRVFERDIDF